MKFRRNPARLAQFIHKFCFDVPGASIPFAEFAARFRAWCPLSERWFWSNYQLSRALQVDYEVGSRTANTKYIGNLAWTSGTPDGELLTVPGNPKHGACRKLIRV